MFVNDLNDELFISLSIVLDASARANEKKQTNNTQWMLSLTYINNLCFVCKCKSANVCVRVRFLYTFAQHNEVPKKYQKVSTERFNKKKSISPRILKIDTNVLNLVYNCKNLKLVRQRKNKL